MTLGVCEDKKQSRKRKTSHGCKKCKVNSRLFSPFFFLGHKEERKVTLQDFRT